MTVWPWEIHVLFLGLGLPIFNKVGGPEEEMAIRDRLKHSLRRELTNENATPSPHPNPDFPVCLVAILHKTHDKVLSAGPVGVSLR